MQKQHNSCLLFGLLMPCGSLFSSFHFLVFIFHCLRYTVSSELSKANQPRAVIIVLLVTVLLPQNIYIGDSFYILNAYICHVFL